MFICLALLQRHKSVCFCWVLCLCIQCATTILPMPTVKNILEVSFGPIIEIASTKYLLTQKWLFFHEISITNTSSPIRRAQEILSLKQSVRDDKKNNGIFHFESRRFLISLACFFFLHTTEKNRWEKQAALSIKKSSSSLFCQCISVQSKYIYILILTVELLWACCWCSIFSNEFGGVLAYIQSNSRYFHTFFCGQTLYLKMSPNTFTGSWIKWYRVIAIKTY